MRAFVFTDESLTRYAGRFVWLELDTEKKENAAARKRLGVVALPTYFIVDPSDGSVAMRWVGGATVKQLSRFLDDGIVAVRDRGLATSANPADRALAKADRHYGEGQDSLAVPAFRAALAAAPPEWPHYSRAVEALLFALDRTGDYAGEAQLAAEAYPRLKGQPSAAVAAGSGLTAALELPDTSALRARLLPGFEGMAREVLADPKLEVADDDRSGLYISLLDARHAAHDSTGALEVAGA